MMEVLCSYKIMKSNARQYENISNNGAHSTSLLQLKNYLSELYEISPKIVVTYST